MNLGIHFDKDLMIWARLVDTFIGSILGLLAGVVLHHKGFMTKAERSLRLLRLYRKSW